MESSTGIKNLKSEVKRHACEGAECRKRIRETRGDERHGWWNEKRSIGCSARSFLLAYGLLRGVPYEVMERHCAEAPNGPFILQLCQKYGGEEWTQQRVSSLLTRPMTEQEAA